MVNSLVWVVAARGCWSVAARGCGSVVLGETLAKHHPRFCDCDIALLRGVWFLMGAASVAFRGREPL
jgi:hypothetical protein